MKLLCLFLLAVGLPAARLSAQVYTLIDLYQQDSRGINDSGAVTGWTNGSGSFVWQDGLTYGLGTLIPGGTTLAYAINNSKQIVGGTSDTADILKQRAFIWENFSMSYLDTPPGTVSWATGINDSGEVSGMYADSTGSFRPFHWKAGVFTDIGTLGGIGSGAAGINELGQIVGSSHLDDTISHAFVWQGGGMTDLGTLGGYISEATAINNAGQIVGSSSLVGASGLEAFLSSGGGMQGLGYLPGSGSGSGSMALGINDSGVVVGGSSWAGTPFANYHAFVWRNGVMTDLNSVSDTAGGWELIRAMGINNRGDIISWAVRNGFQQSVLLRRHSVQLTNPRGAEFWISGEKDTIRWLSGLGPGQQVRLDLSLDSGQTWDTIAAAYPADSQEYVWTVPDTFSAKARIRIASLADPALNDTSNAFKFRGYVLTTTTPSEEYLQYDIVTDAWGLGNTPEDVWPPSWYDRFDYKGTDPFTGRTYLLGGLLTGRHFFFAQSSDFPDWPSFVNTFNVYNCYLSTTLSVYSPSAVSYWASVKDAWGGSCFGFAITNAWAFSYQNLLYQRNPGLPEFTLPIEVHSDTNIIPVINRYFATQFGKQHLNYRAQTGLQKTPNQTLNDLKAMLISDYEPVRTLSMMNNGPGGGGHAILAWKLKQDEAQPQLYHVSVYDNSNRDELFAEIIIDTTGNGGNGTWTFDLWPGWGGPGYLYLRNPAIEYDATPSFPEIEPGSRVSPFILAENALNIHVNGKAEVAITDSAGNVSGYVDSLIRSEIPGSVPLVVENGSKTPPYGYSLVMNPYRVELSKFSQPESREYFFTGNKSFTVGRGGATAVQTDRLFFDGGLSVANPDTDTKSYDFVNIVNETWIEKVYLLNSLSLSRDDSVRIENHLVDGLKLSSFAPSPKTYSLDLEYYAVPGIKRFTGGQIDLGPNSAHILRPDWPSVADSVLKILIDEGNDGTIDDSIFVSNQPTDVRDPRQGAIPSSFALYQNYPNPFNPATVIRYALPEGAHVRLQVVNVLGEVVTTLVDGYMPAGEQMVEWDASAFPGGVYFCRMTAGSFSGTRKMILVR